MLWLKWIFFCKIMCLDQPTFLRYLCPLLTLFSRKGLLTRGKMWPYFFIFSRHIIYNKHWRNHFGWSHTLNSESIKLCNEKAHVYLVADCRGHHWKEFLCKIMCLEEPTFLRDLCPLLTLFSRKGLLTLGKCGHIFSYFHGILFTTNIWETLLDGGIH